ncbi:MAG: hypothetical protein WKF75_00810 [Singulisphaera sp.]
MRSSPISSGGTASAAPKPTAEVLAWDGAGGELSPAIAVQPYGRGRTMAMSTAIHALRERVHPILGRGRRATTRSSGGTSSWLTENSSIGRRRLLAETDKRLYRPGEPIVLKAKAFDENASATLDYRVAVSVEPKSAAEITSDDSPSAVRRSAPAQRVRGTLLPWGEEFDMAKFAAEKVYDAALPIAEAKALPTGVTLTGGIRIELTAYEGNTQVDSTALDVQVLDDPTEQQNPLPDHDLLKRVADASGGSVLRGPRTWSRCSVACRSRSARPRSRPCRPGAAAG